MKLAILSDSHDQLQNLETAIEKITKAEIDTIIFCGDLCSPIPAKKVLVKFTGEIHMVFGNTEDRHNLTNLAYTDVPQLQVHGEFAELEFAGRNIAVTHYPLYAQGLATTGNYDAVFHGHNHTASSGQVGQTLLANPGEIAGFMEEPGFAIYDTENNQLEFVKL